MNYIEQKAVAVGACEEISSGLHVWPGEGFAAPTGTAGGTTGGAATPCRPLLHFFGTEKKRRSDD